MKKTLLFFVALFILGVIVSAFAATGDKPNQIVVPFRNVSSSTKPSGCVVGELKRNTDFIFLCSTSSKWRRVSIGAGF